VLAAFPCPQSKPSLVLAAAVRQPGSGRAPLQALARRARRRRPLDSAPHFGPNRNFLCTSGFKAGVHGAEFLSKLLDLPSQMGVLSYLTGLGGRDMAVDLGTANTLVYVRGRGIVLSEPSVVAIDARNGAVHAVGIEAKRMLGRTPGTISAIRPLKDGVIADFDVTEQMLRHFINKVHQNRFAHPRVVVCVPSGVTGVEKRAVEEACLSAGARHAYLIEEPMAAAIGAGLPVGEPTGSMIVDVGGGTSEVAVISLGGIVVSQSIRIGGDEMDEAIVNYCKHEYKLMIGQQTAEELKLEAASASPLAEEVRAEIRGRDLVSGLPRTITLASEEIRAAIEEPLGAIIGAVKDTLDRTPPELAGDIMDRGITLAGGGALLQGLEQRLRDECQMPCQLAESPLTCVAVGSGLSLEEFEAIHRASKNSGSKQYL
jgi:rod shape-determining protein MreB and related proteins